MERVIQHVGDVDGLVAEAIQITRPGGRIVLVDSDWGSLMVYPGDRDLVDRLTGVFASQILPEPWAGRRLHDALLRHGLIDVQSSIYPIQADDGVLRTLGAMYERYVSSQIMTQHQADDHLTEMASAFRSGRRGVCPLSVRTRPGASQTQCQCPTNSCRASLDRVRWCVRRRSTVSG